MHYNDTFNIAHACLIQKNILPEVCPIIYQDCTHFYMKDILKHALYVDIECVTIIIKCFIRY